MLKCLVILLNSATFESNSLQNNNSKRVTPFIPGFYLIKLSIARQPMCINSVAKYPIPTLCLYYCLVLCNEISSFLLHLHSIITIAIVALFKNIFLF